MINCIALDDEPMALEVIKELCKEVPFINLSHTFTRVSLAQKHLNKFPVDLIFLDIEMPDKNGFEFLKSLNQDVIVIFTTAYRKYAAEGFDVNAIDYLLKPIEPKRLSDAIQKLQAELFKEQVGFHGNNRGPLTELDQVFVKDGERCWFVKLGEIRLF